MTIAHEPTWIRQYDSAPDEPWLYVRRSTILLRQQQLDQALADCNKAIELAPNDVLAYLNRAKVWETSGDYEHVRQPISTKQSVSIPANPWPGPNVPVSGCWLRAARSGAERH